MKTLILILMILMSVSCTPVFALTGDCSDIAAAVEAFTDRVDENNYAVAGFVGDISFSLDRWYSDFSQMEDTTVSIAPGYFSPLADAATEIGDGVTVAYKQAQIVADEGDELVDFIRDCQTATPTP